MTAITVSAPVNMASDATFRSWGSTWSTNLAALGWVKTSDTGQINWTTVTKPTLANTVAGYEIWRMNDSLQATAPVFLKIEYGTGPSATYSSLWFSIGFSTDGAGNLTSTNQSTRTQIYTTQNTTTSYTWKFSGTTSRLGIVELYDLSTQHRYLFIERTHNNDGSDSSFGVMVVFGSNTLSNYSQLVPMTGTVPIQTKFSNTVGNITAAASPTSAPNQVGSTVYLAPVRVFGYGEQCPMVGLMAYYTSDIVTGNLTTVTDWTGASVSVFPTGCAPSYFSLPSAYLSIAMRFD